MSRAAKQRKPCRLPIEKKTHVTAQAIRIALFVRAVAAGKSATRAYVEAGFREGADATTRNEAAKLIAKPYVQEVLKGIHEQILGEAYMTLAERRRFLARVVRTPVGDLDENSDLVARVEKEFGGDSTNKGRRGKLAKGLTRVKIWGMCKLRALELDARLAGELNGGGDGGEEAEGLGKASLDKVTAILELLVNATIRPKHSMQHSGIIEAVPVSRLSDADRKALEFAKQMAGEGEPADETGEPEKP